MQVHSNPILGSSTTQQCFIGKCCNSSIWSVIEAHEYLMEILFDKLSNEFGLTLISSQQDSQIITIMLFFLSTLNNSSLEDAYLFAQGD